MLSDRRVVPSFSLLDSGNNLPQVDLIVAHILIMTTSAPTGAAGNTSQYGDPSVIEINLVRTGRTEPSDDPLSQSNSHVHAQTVSGDDYIASRYVD